MPCVSNAGRLTVFIISWITVLAWNDKSRKRRVRSPGRSGERYPTARRTYPPELRVNLSTLPQYRRITAVLPRFNIIMYVLYLPTTDDDHESRRTTTRTTFVSGRVSSSKIQPQNPRNRRWGGHGLQFACICIFSIIEISINTKPCCYTDGNSRESKNQLFYLIFMNLVFIMYFFPIWICK